MIHRPTPEEAKSWENDFMGLLHHKYGLNVFQEFLRTQYGDENLNFWMAVEEYKKISDKNSRNDMARMIYEDYVSTLSPTEVAIKNYTLFSLVIFMGEGGARVFSGFS